MAALLTVSPITEEVKKFMTELTYHYSVFQHGYLRYKADRHNDRLTRLSSPVLPEL